MAGQRPSAYIDALHCCRGARCRSAECRDRLRDREHARDATSTPPSRDSSKPAASTTRSLAAAYARTAAEIKGRGRLRVIRELLARGVDKGIAAEAVAEVFGEKDERSLVTRALQKKLRDGRTSARRGRIRAPLSISDAPRLHARRRRRIAPRLRGGR